MIAAILLGLGLLSSLPAPFVLAANPFSSNVVALTPRNWRREVEDSPHGYCQLLQPEWEKLAGGVKGTVKVAYWDTEQGQAPPRLLGEIKGTPTIRLFKPKKKQKPGSYKEKTVVEYQFERKAVDMKRFVDAQMPDFSEKIKQGLKELQAFDEKAARNGLPRAMLFVSKSQTMPLTKYLSTEFRRKLLLAEIKPTSKNQEIMDKFGVTEFPALIVFPVAAQEGEAEDSSTTAPEMVRYDGDGFSRNKLHSFLSKYALKKIATPAPKKQPEEEAEKKQEEPPPRKTGVKEEL